jgi:hypothetical protein
MVTAIIFPREHYSALLFVHALSPAHDPRVIEIEHIELDPATQKANETCVADQRTI